MPKFRKKPIVIEAIQWTGTNLRELITFTDGPPDNRSMHAGMGWGEYENLVARDGLKIFTPGGPLIAKKSYWIIKGTRGEHWIVNNDIFAETYEKI